MKKILGLSIATLMVGSMLIGCGSAAETTTEVATDVAASDAAVK